MWDPSSKHKSSADGQQQPQFDHLRVSFIIPIHSEWSSGQDGYLNLIWRQRLPLPFHPFFSLFCFLTIGCTDSKKCTVICTNQLFLCPTDLPVHIEVCVILSWLCLCDWMKQEKRETNNQIEGLLEYVYQLYLSSVCASQLIVSSVSPPTHW